MLRDVFYYGIKPNVHPREQYAEDLNDARTKATTEHFWIINEFCDYRNFDWDFDFEFLPDEDVWAEDHNNVWPSQHQKDSGTWLCPKEYSELIIYRGDVDPVIRKNEKQSDNWVELDLIDHNKFDFSWHPDPTDPPFIYKWGCKFFPAELKHVLEYRVPGATREKYMNAIVELLQQEDVWVEHQEIDKHKFDMSWRPNPLDPPFIYIWGNKYIDGKLKPTLEYHTPNATDKKYMPEKLEVLPEWDRWVEVQEVDKKKFDFAWRPDPREPAYIYTWGNKHIDAELRPTLEYHCEGATERKYMSNDVAVLPEKNRWKILENILDGSFDFTWRPDPREPSLIYVFGNDIYDAVKMPTIEYHCEGATERKYMDIQKAKLAPNANLYEHLEDSYLEDYSWLPDPDSPPYIYVWGNQWNAPEDKISVQFVVQGATEYKYMTARAIRRPCLDNWVIPDDVDTTGFDFSWEPSPAAPPYIYEFGTQWQKTGGPRYVVEGATEIKYMDFQKVIKLPSFNENWNIIDNIDKDRFDFSWHPDATDPPYIYAWGNQWVSAEDRPAIEYKVEGATEYRYMDELAVRLPTKDNWVVPDDVDTSGFDFSWEPSPKEEPFIYQFGTQWQKTGGPKYVINEDSPVKYVDIDNKAVKLADLDNINWVVNYKIKDFDFSWHPDETEEPYIYVFGNNLYPGEECATVKYCVPGATTIKYIGDIIATLDVNLDNWEIPDDVDTSEFDFSWIPNPNDPPYIYEFGTQWQKTGGPKYLVPNATETQYVDFQKAKKLPSIEGWTIPDNIDIDRFDFSWHPDSSSPPYVYVFATQWAFTGGPVYAVPGATEFKYIDDQTATAIVSMDNWEYDIDLIDVEEFDFSWHPYVEDQPYIYQFGTQWQKTGGPRYITPGATANSPVKYIDTRIIKAKRLPNKKSFTILDNLVIEDFDYSWHPDETEEPYIYVFGNNQYPAEIMPTIEYRVDGAEQVKYIRDAIATLGQDKNNWIIHEPIDKDSFDFSWKPNPLDPPYIYVFGNQHYSAEIYPTVEYHTPNAVEKKYVNDITAKLVGDKKRFKLLYPIVEDKFDFTWRPNPLDPPYTYVFGNQYYSAEEMPTVEYKVEGATEIKYINDVVAYLAPNMTNWDVPAHIDTKSFDFSWVPHPKSPPYVYEFATVWNDRGGPRYVVPGATEFKYVEDIKAKTLPDRTNWEIPDNVDASSFDFSWVPHPKSPPYVYEFATVWNDRGGPKYFVKGATEYFYVEDIKAKTLPNRKNWEIPENIEVGKFDFSWVPHPQAPAYIYQFGTKLDNNDGPRYITPNNNGEVVYLERVETDEVISIPVRQYYIETTLEDLIKQHPDEIFWALRKNIDYETFNFNWRPGTVEVAYELDYVHVFGSAESEVTQTYFVSSKHYLQGKTDFKFVETVSLNEETLSQIFIKPDMFYVDKGNKESQERFETLKEKFGNKIQKTRYLNSWVDTINRCINRATTEVIWVLNSELDYTNFDFDYYPNPWQMKMVQVFGTQWSHWGTTFMVNRESFIEDTKYVKIIEHLSTLNFVKSTRALATNCVYDVVLIDHGNDETSTIVELLQSKVGDKSVSTIKYDTSYLNTIRQFVNKLPEKKEHYLWLCSSVCDYNTFDFTYICDPFARDNLHVFPSGRQKFGDTFLVDVNKTREIINELDSLENYYKVNYNNTLRVERLPAPEIVTGNDTLVEAVKSLSTQNFPYSIITTEDNIDLPETQYEPINLWAPDTKNIIVTTTGNSRIIAPREVADHVKKELYDYPYIKRAPKLVKSNPMDIVFLSNGESCADEHYEHLIKVTEGLPNRVVRVDGVNGRAAAYHAAAEASNTPWMFTVFAKLKVSPKFDWNWQPDRMQVPKHYIFHAKNPVNGLTYGHQAMIAYNKKLTLANEGRGLDFTLDDEHEIVPLISGTAHYNTDPFSTWRTAFREVLKLKADDSEESRVRLDAWLNKAEGEYSEYSIKGALDAEEYYEDVEGDFDKLKLSYEWDWLRKRFEEL